MDDKFFIAERPTAYEQRTINAQDVPRLIDVQPPGRPRPASTLSNQRMIAFVVVMMSILAVLAGGLTWLANKQEAALAGTPSNGCNNELMLLEIARNAGPVVSVEKQGADIVAKVSWRSWVKITRQAQVGIAMAAYCPVAPADKRGIARVVDEDGKELGRVVSGDWQSKLFSD